MTKELSAQTFYQILGVGPSASQAEIKSAYRRVLLSSHPDKRPSLSEAAFDVAHIQDAYRILSDADARAAYDASLARSNLKTNCRTDSVLSRPAQVVSLEEFSCAETEGAASVSSWTYACRCGGVYHIAEADMEENRHLIGCNQCSEIIYVGYEIMEDEPDPN